MWILLYSLISHVGLNSLRCLSLSGDIDWARIDIFRLTDDGFYITGFSFCLNGLETGNLQAAR
jgi:hypothetical protein